MHLYQVGRLANGSIVEDPVKFPSGIRSLTDYLHSKGLKFGIYTARAPTTCSHRPGSKGFEPEDAERFCNLYNIDFIKVHRVDLFETKCCLV